MTRQCAWCRKIYDIHTGKWQNGPAERLMITSFCPECKKNLVFYHR